MHLKKRSEKSNLRGSASPRRQKNGRMARPFGGRGALGLLACLALSGADIQARAQIPEPSPETLPASPGQQELPPPQGQILMQSHGDAPALPAEPGLATPSKTEGQPIHDPIQDQTLKADLTDADRSALLITSYNLDARLRPIDSGLSVRSMLTVRNSGEKPLKQLAFQISSSLRWESASLLKGEVRTQLPVAQHRLETDADHTGAETELVLTLPEPLAPGASANLDLFYDGTVPQSAARLQRLGATAAQQIDTDWDAISPAWTGLRGFGNVLWYPVASPQLFLAEGNTLFQAVGRTRLREEAAAIRLRLSIDYSGEPPVAAYFCGRRQSFTAVTDSPNSPTEAGSGIATAIFGTEALGFRTPSLFVLQQPEILADPPGNAPGADRASEASIASDSSSSSSSSSNSAAPPNDAPATQPLLRRGGALSASAEPFLAMEGAGSDTIHDFSAAAYRSSALLREWLGPKPLTALTALEHEGQPFEDGPLLVAPLRALASPLAGPALIQSLTHAWVQTGQPWMDDGLAQFFALLSIERQDGRPAAVASLSELMKPVILVEPDPASTTQAPAAEPLIAASSDLIYRRKAAAVWWMLRGIVGDGNLHAALSAMRVQPVSTDSPATQAITFQHLLERLSHQELGWFFNDWILQDKGLPDLTIADVTVAEEPGSPSHNAGWLVAVTVRNEGGAGADVPLVVTSGANNTARRMRIAGRSTATERVLLETAPTSVTLNDGSTPEERTSTHTSEIHLNTGRP